MLFFLDFAEFTGFLKVSCTYYVKYVIYLPI